MKTKFFSNVLLALSMLALPATQAFAREGVMIVNHENVTVATGSGKPVNADQVKLAISNAATAKNWTIAQQGDGKLSAALTVRGKHHVIVEISYSSDKYSLIYKDSTNMNYGRFAARPVPGQISSDITIHPNYNKWVDQLMQGIRSELLRL